MASVKSAIVKPEHDKPWRAGLRKRRYTVVLTDNDLIDHEILLMPVKVDALDTGDLAALDALENETAREIVQAIAGTYSGISPETINPVWNTQQEFDRRVLGQLMTVIDSAAFLTALDFFQAVEGRGGANAGQRANYLGVSRANYDLVSTRFGDVQGAAFFINDEKLQIWSEIPPEFLQ